MLVEAGVVSKEEITARAIERGATDKDLIAARPDSRPDPLGPQPIAVGNDRALAEPPLFAVGNFVRTIERSVPGHTRLPAYARGKVGEVVTWHDGWVFPDTSAHGQGEQPQHLYTVRFASEELWNRTGFSVSLDLFEPYLTRVDNE